MKLHLVVTAAAVGCLLTGCVKRIPAYDEARRPISEEEIARHKTHRYLTLYAAAGTAVSFGAGFVIGTLIDRSEGDERNTAALWGPAVGAAVIGGIVFGIQGHARDYNEAVETVRELRKKEASQEISKLRARRQQLEEEKRRLEAARRKQEAEKKALEEKLKREKARKQKKNDHNQ